MTNKVRDNLLITFVSSAYNEEANLKELYKRCNDSVETAQKILGDSAVLKFRMVIADNASTDRSRDVLREICSCDRRVIVLLNRRNYGPEASTANALRYATSEGLIVLLCSDLQDPPEHCSEMIITMHTEKLIDGILACKRGAKEAVILQGARRAYYSFLSYSSRLSSVSKGYHGFGCYRTETIRVAIDTWDSSNLNLRQCLEVASEESRYMEYQPSERVGGRSSYTISGYIKEACSALVAGDATTSRASMLLALTGLFISAVLGALVILNTFSGRSNYESGTPTIMIILLGCFAAQMLMTSLLSRQIEDIRNQRLRSRVRYATLKHE